MALLQVRDFPQELYVQLTKHAEEQNRSITQQTIFLLKQCLGENSSGANTVKRADILNRLNQLNLSLPEDSPLPEMLVREDRNR